VYCTYQHLLVDALGAGKSSAILSQLTVTTVNNALLWTVSLKFTLLVEQDMDEQKLNKTMLKTSCTSYKCDHVRHGIPRKGRSFYSPYQKSRRVCGKCDQSVTSSYDPA